MGKSGFVRNRHGIISFVNVYSILNQPFDFSQAFDRALKNIVNTLGSRPAQETAEDTASITPATQSYSQLIDIDVLLRLHWQPR